ncbi:MAG: hypothetical protein IPQ07_16295 [Myxococcales bacterium]|nr:hypothetical protein [Myxococcales bacterium]
MATVGTLVALGTPLTILHVMSLFLVVSLGVDFGIFFVDTMASLEEAARTMVSILTASLTTILSFGLLGLSQSPGLAAIGVTVTLGVTFSLVCCFLMAALAGPRLVAKVAARTASTIHAASSTGTRSAVARSAAVVTKLGLVTFVGMLALAACGHPPRQSTISASAPAEYPGVLHDPSTIAQNFMVRQSLKIRTQRDGSPSTRSSMPWCRSRRHAPRDRPRPDGRQGVHAHPQGRQDRVRQLVGPELPFSPRNIVVDVHRVFFKRLPAPTDAHYSGVLKGELDGEHVEETWQEGQLRASVFTRPGEPKLKGAIRVQLGAGCEPAHCEPVSATLRNGWFGYRLTIVNEGYERL